MNTPPTTADQSRLTTPSLDRRSIELRKRMVRVMESSQRGHLASAFSSVEILRVLYDDVLNYDSGNPAWPGRDRCVFSKGHGCIALYVLLAEKGFFPEFELDRFCKSDGILGGHPERGVPGIEASTGSLGHGLSISVGFAINAKYQRSPHRTFAIIGDGESNEGSVWEAALCASKHKLDNLTVIVDYNKHQSYGSTYEIQNLEPITDKWTSFGFETTEVDGHNVDQLRTALLNLPDQQGKPNALICHTVKGKGITFMENNMEWHHKNRVTDEEVQSLMAALDGVC